MKLYRNCEVLKKLKVDIRGCMVQGIVYLIHKACWEMEMRGQKLNKTHR